MNNFRFDGGNFPSYDVLHNDIFCNYFNILPAILIKVQALIKIARHKVAIKFNFVVFSL